MRSAMRGGNMPTKQEKRKLQKMINRELAARARLLGARNIEERKAYIAGIEKGERNANNN